MPVYKFKCDLCKIEFEEIISVTHRDNLAMVAVKRCKRDCENKYVMPDSKDPNKKWLTDCQLRRVPTSGSFKI